MTAEKYFSKNMSYNFLPIVDDRNITRDSWWKNEIATKCVLEELGRISHYTLQGDLEL